MKITLEIETEVEDINNEHDPADIVFGIAKITYTEVSTPRDSHTEIIYTRAGYMYEVQYLIDKIMWRARKDKNRPRLNFPEPKPPYQSPSNPYTGPTSF